MDKDQLSSLSVHSCNLPSECQKVDYHFITSDKVQGSFTANSGPWFWFHRFAMLTSVLFQISVIPLSDEQEEKGTGPDHMLVGHATIRILGSWEICLAFLSVMLWI